MFSKLIRILLVIQLALPINALALAEKFIDTDCQYNGDGSADQCAASANAAGAWKSWSQSVTGLAGTLPDATIVHMKGAAADTANVDITSIATSETNTLSFVGDWSGGTYNASKYHLINNSYYALVQVKANYVTIKGVQLVSTTATADGYGAGIRTGVGSEGGAVVLVGNLIMKDTAYPNTSTSNIGIQLNMPGANQKVIIANNIFTGWQYRVIGIDSADNDTYIINNNTASNCSGAGLSMAAYGSNDSVYAKNNIFNCTGDDYALESTLATYTHSKNISTDATSPDTAYLDKTIGFVDAANGNYHLASTDTDAIDQGDDLSSDAQYPFSTDIDGQTRSGTWDIGADEYQSSVNYKLLLLRNELEY